MGRGTTRLFAGTGNDAVDGGRDDDYLDGREGDDALTGGPGRDVFAYYAKDYDKPIDSGADTITDFDGAGETPFC